MRYSVHYNTDFIYFDEIDEIIFDVNKGGSAYEAISENIPAIVKDTNKSIVINFSTNSKDDINQALPFINKLKQDYPNIMAQIDYHFQKSYIDILKDNNIPYMFVNFANNKSDFYQFAHMGVAEIYVVEDLGFEIGRLKQIKEECGVRVRVFPDVSQVSKKWAPIPEITSFFVRPEDVHLYEPYVDTMEFFHRDKKLSAIYKIYKEQQWRGPLMNIIAGSKLEIPGTAIPPHFGLTRIDCKKDCMLSKCRCCMNIQSFAEEAMKAGLTINYPKVEKELNLQDLIGWEDGTDAQ